jgi:hypothetical protein
MDTSSDINRQGKTIKLRVATLDRINALKHKGQSYDGLITELLDLHDGDDIDRKGTRPSKQTRNEDDRT